ncbi:MAG: hypothetical protein LBQ86_02470, partial [Holophagales bacterium]|nr:hypothetical protein [Holophagales bacterium]
MINVNIISLLSRFSPMLTAKYSVKSTTDWDKTVTATLEAKITHKGISNTGTLEFTSDGWRQGLDLDNPTFDKNVIEVSGMKTGETVTR